MRNALGQGARMSLKYPASITGRYFVNRAWKQEAASNSLVSSMSFPLGVGSPLG